MVRGCSVIEPVAAPFLMISLHDFTVLCIQWRKSAAGLGKAIGLGINMEKYGYRRDGEFFYT